jgi:hypothetical protein
VLPELWRLCASGDLVLDELNVEMHLVNVNRTEPLRVRDIFSVFAGALQCELASTLVHRRFQLYQQAG